MQSWLQEQSAVLSSICDVGPILLVRSSALNAIPDSIATSLIITSLHSAAVHLSVNLSVYVCQMGNRINAQNFVVGLPCCLLTFFLLLFTVRDSFIFSAGS